MNLADVMKEAAVVLDEIVGLAVRSYPAASITPPAGYVSYPQSINYDQTYGRGVDRITDLPMTLLCGKVTEYAARDLASAWCEGSGPASVKARMEAHRWLSCSDFTVTGCTFDVEQLGAVPYLAVVFTATIMGRGK